MTTRLVVDASVSLGWILGDAELFGRARSVLLALKTARMLVPAIWQVEVANVLLVKERQKRITESQVRKCLRHLEELDIEVDGGSTAATFDRVLPLARRHQLSAYDGSYLELAMRERAPLVSFDQALLAAAKREGVEFFGFAAD